MFKEVPIARSLRIAFGGGLVGMSLVSAPSFAQTNDTVQQGERVQVTGSSIKRIEGESALPVTVIKREDIDKLGVVSAQELLSRVAANNGGGYNSTQALGDAGKPGFSGASLHGLGSTNTLLLLNGRRIAVYAFDGGGASLSNIPLAAIERVEILRDGASAIYGTDAIAGVINFITRKDFTGAVLDAAYYSTDNKGGNYGNATGTFGYGDLQTQGFNIFGSADYRKQGSIAANERSYSGTAYRPDLGVNRLSSNAVPANIITASGFVNPYAPKYLGVANSCAQPKSFGTSPTDSRCRFDYASVIDIYNPTESESVFLRGTVQLGANNQLFVEGMHSETRQKFAISPTPASEATVFNVGQNAVLYPKTGKYYPGNGITPAVPGVPNLDTGGYPGFADVYLRTLAAGPRTDVSKEKFDRGLVGLDGSGFGWDYNLGLLHTRDRVTDSFTDGYISESRLLRAGGLTPKQPGYVAAASSGIDPNFNPFSITQDAAGQAAIDATKIKQVVRTGDSKRDSIDGHASREIFNLPAGPLAIALGGEYRREKYDDVPASILSSGDVIGSGGDLQPTDSARRVYAGFFELSVPVIKSIEFGLAGRYDHYSDFGSTTNPKATLRFQPVPEVLLRGSVGTGFRAPTLPELFQGITQTNSGGTYNDPYYDNSAGFKVTDNSTGEGGRCASDAGFNGTYCNAQLKTKLGGNAKLVPEKSNQYAVGFLLEPSSYVSFGADYFHIKQKQLIGAVNQDVQLQDFIDNFNPTTLSSSSIYAPNVVTRFDTNTNTTVINYVGAFNQNLGIQITKGVDFSFKGRLPVSAYGQFGLNIEATYLISQKNKQPGQTQFSEGVGSYAFSGPVQRFKHVTTGTYDFGPYGAAVVYNYGSGYADETPNRTVGANETWDVLGSYTGIKGLRITLGVKNLLDRNPPVSNATDYFQVGYDPTIGDPHGRAYYARLTYTYK